MRHPWTSRAVRWAGLALGLLVATPLPAAADITAFVATTSSRSEALHKGISAGFSLLFVGFDFEYYRAAEDEGGGVPSLSMGSANVYVETPTGRVRLYGTLGVGVYRETLADYASTNTSANAGGGLTIGLAGPLGLRLDYRVIRLRDSRRGSSEQRWYAGVNLRF